MHEYVVTPSAVDTWCDRCGDPICIDDPCVRSSDGGDVVICELCAEEL